MTYIVHRLKDGVWSYPRAYKSGHKYYVLETDELINNVDIYNIREEE